jgi:anti-sigma B factor antagonist
MENTDFGATLVTTADGAPVVELKGTVNRAAMQAMDTAYRQAAEGTSGEILFDFSDVDYINSTGIAVIVGLLASARADGREIGAVGLTDHYKEVFEITRLSDFLNIYESAKRD